MDYRVKAGDLVTFEPWDCEGIEMPFGFSELAKLWDPVKKKNKEDLRRKVKITPGITGMVAEVVELQSEDENPRTLYWCMVEGRRLIVGQHFINKVQEVA